jgi:hypothetical protein
MYICVYLSATYTVPHRNTFKGSIHPYFVRLFQLRSPEMRNSGGLVVSLDGCVGGYIIGIVPLALGALSLGVKRPGRETDHLHLVPRSKNAWSYASIHGVVLS